MELPSTDRHKLWFLLQCMKVEQDTQFHIWLAILTFLTSLHFNGNRQHREMALLQLVSLEDVIGCITV